MTTTDDTFQPTPEPPQMADTWKKRLRAFATAKATKTTVFAAITLMVIAGAICLYLIPVTPADMSRNPEHLRNIMIIIAGFTTLAISIWRARIADKQANASNTQARATMGQIRIAEQGQITERFTRAIEQLGKSGAELLFLRIGAIQALERIGNDSRDDLPAILRLLAGFARETSIVWNEDRKKQEQTENTPPDVAEAIAALSRLNNEHFGFLREREISIDLSDSRLPRLDLPNSNLARFELRNCNLSDAKLWNANLSNANLLQANLSDAKLWQANLSDAILWGANLSNADLCDANLSNVFIWRANISDANLEDSDLSGADIEGINLDPESGEIREETTELLSKIKYDRDNPPKNCPEGVELPPPRDD